MRFERLLVFLILISCNSKPNAKNEDNKISTDTAIFNTSKTNAMAYKQQLEATKKHYPFDNWQESYNDGLEQYTQEIVIKLKQFLRH